MNVVRHLLIGALTLAKVRAGIEALKLGTITVLDVSTIAR